MLSKCQLCFFNDYLMSLKEKEGSFKGDQRLKLESKPCRLNQLERYHRFSTDWRPYISTCRTHGSAHTPSQCSRPITEPLICQSTLCLPPGFPLPPSSAQFFLSAAASPPPLLTSFLPPHFHISILPLFIKPDHSLAFPLCAITNEPSAEKRFPNQLPLNGFKKMNAKAGA